jgi:uncharacterized protein YdeI (BOF family)
MKTVVSIVLAVLVVGAGIWYAFFTGTESRQHFGLPTGTEITSIGTILANPAAYLNKVVTVEGELTKECPSGCWWYVKDRTGEIRVDSFGGGFALALRQEGKRVRSTGTIVAGDNGVPEIAATGASLL